MNKRIKLTIACLLLIGTFSSICPEDFFNITTKAYAAAATYSLANNGELKSLEIKSTENKSLDLYDYYNGQKKNLTDEKEYYITLDEKSNGLKVLAECEGDDYVVKVFESDKKTAIAHEVGEEMSFLKGMSAIYIRTYISKEAFERAKDKEDISNCVKTYKINVNKAEIKDTNTNEVNTNELNTNTGSISVDFNKDAITNQWVNKWQYNDASGNPLKNVWLYDKNSGKNYYLQADGAMATGWLKNNRKWYYLGSDGVMKTGWILDGSKYYYLYNDGTMAYNTVIDGFKVGNDGAWIN
ncbi:hypothetical protein psyc5s11_51060 [Clostridium gelidum]|uniref:Uncharacterized protein n=1 Tax=Clostridium gelidum TaxID=704125 RepID=A0ABN6J3Y3_9CLOT|nr:hypothetical protein [Clostridium gelidum]BCZ49039.1 hypothetical protein psyc5s11_51060 [Clostridium gelidum]